MRTLNAHLEVFLSCTHNICQPMQEACAAFADSIAELVPAELLHMGMDSAGSRSLEAFLGSAVSTKVKKQIIRKLAGSYAKLGSSPGGSHVAQACYRTAVSSALTFLRLLRILRSAPGFTRASSIPARDWQECIHAPVVTWYSRCLCDRGTACVICRGSKTRR